MDMLVRFFSTIPIELLAAIVTLLAGVATNVLTEEMLPKLRRGSGQKHGKLQNPIRSRWRT